MLAVVREFLNSHVSRSGLDRCMRRHGVGNLRALKPKEATPTHSSFKAYEPGYLHTDIKYLSQMADEDRRRYLFVAIDRATRWVFVRIGSVAQFGLWPSFPFPGRNYPTDPVTVMPSAV